MHHLPKLTFLLFIIMALLMVACADEGDPAQSTEDYLKALADRNVDELLRLSCAEQDAGIQQRVDSFPAGATVENMSCERQDDAENTAIVSCAGTFSWVYEGSDETNQRPLGDWQLVKEDDEWRVCGAAP